MQLRPPPARPHRGAGRGRWTSSPTPGNLESLADVAAHPRYAFVRADIADRDAVRALFAEHAPRRDRQLRGRDPRGPLDRRPRGLRPHQRDGDLRAARGGASATSARPGAAEGFRFLHVSTDEVYGTLGPDGAFSETTPYAPNSPYAASKAGADHLVRAYHETYRLPGPADQLLEQLRPLPVPGEAHPPHDPQRGRGPPAPHLRRRRERAGLAVRGGPLRGDPAGAAEGAPGREVQHRRRQRADEPPGRRRAVRHPRRGAARRRNAALGVAGPVLLLRPQELRARPPRPRPALRHRRHEGAGGARVVAAPRLRGRPAGDGALVPASTASGARRCSPGATSASGWASSESADGVQADRGSPTSS